MLDQTKNLLIGIFVLTAIGIIIYIILFLHPSMGDEGQTLRVRFSNIDKVGVGTRVLFAGRPVGEVTSIQEVPGARLEKEIRNGEIYIYELTLKIDSGVSIYTSDEVAAKTSGLLGEKSVSISPLPPEPGKPLIKVTDQILYASAPPSVDEAIKEFNTLARKAQVTMDQLTDGFNTLKQDKFWENLAAAVKNVNEITVAINKPKDLEQILANALQVTEDFRNSSGKMVKGEGTLGRLLVQDDFYLHLTSVMSKAETLMDDINHFGLLFQNDKTWQRIRARRANLLAKLSSPQEFRNFFNDEVNQISTSLSRVSMILQDATNPECLPVICSPEFTRVFAELLRRVSELEDHLKMFDQQVVEKRERDCNCFIAPIDVVEDIILLEGCQPPFQGSD